MRISRRRAREEEWDGPTPETLAKREDDWRLDLPPEHQWAVHQIRLAHRQITAPVGLAVPRDRAHANANETEAEIERELTYRGWRAECARRGIPRMGELAWLIVDELVTRAVIGYRLRDVEAALMIYCEGRPEKAA